MNALRKYLGIVWIALAIAVGYFSINIFGYKLSTGNQEDLVFGIIIFFILLPMIVTGLTIFGWYALTDEYKE
jgi:amino acid transporter